MSIKVESLYHTYMKGSPFEKTALEDINLTINPGEFTGLIGPTGSGKSTLIQHFNGLLKPSSGRVLVNGIDVSGRNLKELRKHVGIVFQYPEYQLFEETVYKDIAFGLKKTDCSEKQMEVKIYEAIEAVGLKDDVMYKSPFELSGGQKRRVAIAGIIVMKPEILILDEPAAGLDPQGREELYDLIVNMHKKYKMTIILVSHSMEDIARLAQRVVVINKGRIVMEGVPVQVFSHREELESIGLSLPQISYLFERLKKYLPELDGCVFTVEEAKKAIVKKLKNNYTKKGP
jgi:energy-coupling factor transport system ATP-binding protein